MTTVIRLLVYLMGCGFNPGLPNLRPGMGTIVKGSVDVVRLFALGCRLNQAFFTTAPAAVTRGC
ncbi:MAG TPA: hypothetical protein V6D03_07780 [Candidatus Caenarcaniphilales bacterium]